MFYIFIPQPWYLFCFPYEQSYHFKPNSYVYTCYIYNFMKIPGVHLCHFHRIIEYLKLEDTHKDHQVQLQVWCWNDSQGWDGKKRIFFLIYFFFLPWRSEHQSSECSNWYYVIFFTSFIFYLCPISFQTSMW